jgi:hypothetical protein
LQLFKLLSSTSTQLLLGEKTRENWTSVTNIMLQELKHRSHCYKPAWQRIVDSSQSSGVMQSPRPAKPLGYQRKPFTSIYYQSTLGNKSAANHRNPPSSYLASSLLQDWSITASPQLFTGELIINLLGNTI